MSFALNVLPRIKSLSGFLDMSDDDALYYANVGQRYLESRIDRRNGILQHQYNLSPGDWYLTLTGIRSINAIFYTSSDKRVTLEETSIVYMKENSLVPFDSTVDVVSNGTPSYWCWGYGKHSGSASSPTSEDADTPGSDVTDNTILIGLPPDTAGTLTIIGRFTSIPLSATTVANFWTDVFPEALLYATLMHIEGSYRNREGVNDYKVMVNDVLDTIVLEDIEHDYQTIDRIL